MLIVLREAVRGLEIDFIDHNADEPVRILQFIGRRPITALGDSDGDFEMLEWTTSSIDIEKVE